MNSHLLKSVAVHTALLLPAIFYLRSPVRPRPEFEVTVFGKGSGGRSERATVATRSQPKRRGNSKPPVNQPSPKLGIDFFRENSAPTHESSSASTETADGTESGRGPRKGEGNGFSQAEGMGLQREGMLYPFFLGVWKKIDRTLQYPNDFIQRRIQGEVTIQFEVNRQGMFTGKIIEVSSEVPMLKAYVIPIIVHSLRSPLPEKLWADQERMIVVGRFIFRTFGPGENHDQRETRQFKNVLAFERASYVEPKVNEAINHFFETYFPPILPVPGGFIIDFVRAYRMIEGIGKPDPERLRNFRLEQSLEQWQDVIRQSNDKTPQAVE